MAQKLRSSIAFLVAYIIPLLVLAALCYNYLAEQRVFVSLEELRLAVQEMCLKPAADKGVSEEVHVMQHYGSVVSDSNAFQSVASLSPRIISQLSNDGMDDCEFSVRSHSLSAFDQNVLVRKGVPFVVELLPGSKRMWRKKNMIVMQSDEPSDVAKGITVALKTFLNVSDLTPDGIAHHLKRKTATQCQASIQLLEQIEKIMSTEGNIPFPSALAESIAVLHKKISLGERSIVHSTIDQLSRNPLLVPQLYMPPSQMLAIYAPLFLPMIVAIISGGIRIVKERRNGDL